MDPLLKRSVARDSKAKDHTVLPVTHSRTMPAFTPQPQGITALWLVLVAPTHGGMARLSWSGWLVIYWDRFSRTGSWTPDTVTHPNINRGRRRVTSLIKTNALTTTPNRQQSISHVRCSWSGIYLLYPEKLTRQSLTFFDQFLRQTYTICPSISMHLWEFHAQLLAQKSG